MAHFARIDEENKVTQVTAVADAVLDDKNFSMYQNEELFM